VIWTYKIASRTSSRCCSSRRDARFCLVRPKRIGKHSASPATIMRKAVSRISALTPTFHIPRGSGDSPAQTGRSRARSERQSSLWEESLSLSPGQLGSNSECSTARWPETISPWLGRRDSNPGMAVPKTAALPLGDAPVQGEADSYAIRALKATAWNRRFCGKFAARGCPAGSAFSVARDGVAPQKESRYSPASVGV
jgi:hypothetical protein